MVKTLSTFRLIHPHEFEETYQLIEEASLWLKAKGIQQWEEPITKENFQLAIEAKEVFVLIKDQKVAGSVTLSKHKDFYWGEVTEPAIHLHRLVVSRAFKGQNLGEELLSLSSDYTRQQGLEFLRLDCRATNNHLRVFYASHGFIFKGLAHGAFEYALFEKNCQ